MLNRFHKYGNLLDDDEDGDEDGKASLANAQHLRVWKKRQQAAHQFDRLRQSVNEGIG